MSEANNQKDRAAKTLRTMFDYLGLDADVCPEVQENRLVLKITSQDAGRIIGRKGQTLESLQTLLNRIMFRGDDCPRIMLDIDGYASGNNRGGDRRNDDRRGDRASDEDYPRPRRRRDDGEGGRGPAVPEEQLRSQALDAGKEVKRWGEPVTLPEMNAHDRRIIHVTLQDDPELETRSEGEGALKKVIISLKKAE